jgi:uncharacterized membrane protein (DUF441 family)
LNLESTLILLAILVASVLGKANSVAVASCLLLIVKLLNIEQHVFPIIEKNGVFWGIVLLIAAILIPIANGKITFIDIKGALLSKIGIIALLLSLFTTYLSGIGLNYLTVQGNTDVMPALIFGAVAAAAFLGGVPVGPLIASGMLALVAKVINK